MQEHELVDNVREIGIPVESLLNNRLGSHPHVGDIRGRGMLWGFGS